MKRILSILILMLNIYFNVTWAQTPPAKTWFENNQGIKTQPKEKWDEDENGFKHGKYIRYDYSYIGNDYYVAEIGNYFHGKKSGEWKLYYDNGNLCSIGIYVNDLKSGKWKEYNDQNIYQEGSYSQNVRVGEWINTNDENILLPKTEKGYRTIYSNGFPIHIYTPSGEDILLKKKNEEELAEKERIENQKLAKYQEQLRSDFNIAMGKYEDIHNYYGDTTYLSNFLKKYPDADKNYIDKAKYAIATKADNDAFYQAQSIDTYVAYQKKFPQGIHYDEIENLIKKNVLNYSKEYITAINTLLENSNPQRVIFLCEIVLKYKSDLHNSYYSPITIYYALSLWSIGDKNKAVDVLKAEWSSVINFSDGSTKFKDKFFVIYDQYKKQLKIDSDKETYKRIKAL